MIDDASRTAAICPTCGKPFLSAEAQLDLDYMKKHAGKRGGFMWESARRVYERGEYHVPHIVELLAAGLIEPHPDPAKGWILKP